MMMCSPSLAQDKSVTITNLDIRYSDGIVAMRFTADAPLKSVQKPETNGAKLTLRFTGAENGIDDLSALMESPVSAISSNQKRSTVAYYLTLAHAIDSCVLLREGRSKVVVKVYLHDDNRKPELPKPKAGKEKPAAKLDHDNDDADKTPASKKKWALDVIVIDPGHGGKDPGTKGVTGVLEKDVVLGIGKKLGSLIKKNMIGTKVVYTRSDDTFIELDRRGQLANEAGGKLFVSIHCNSTPKKPSPANGFEVYILRPGRSDDAVRVAEFENSAIQFEANAKRYKKLTEEQFIIVNMAQSSFVKFSDKFASLLTREIKGTTSLANRGVSQAGFFVLVGASMPNVLIETAFLSNKKDEKYLKSDKGQQQLAGGMFQAIKAYREYYEQQLRKN